MVRTLLAVILGLIVWSPHADVWSAGVVLGPPTSAQPPPHRSRGGWTLDPVRPVVPPPLPTLPLPAPKPPAPPQPPPPAMQRVDCLQWDYPETEADLVAKFVIQITGGRLAGAEVGIANVPKQVREVGIERLLLFQDGRYTVTMVAVDGDNHRGESSTSVCLHVTNRQVYSCDGEDVPRTCGQPNESGG